MKLKIFAFTALVSGAFGLSAFAAESFGPLIEPAALSDELAADAPLVLDIRGAAYDEGHIPGAVSAPYADFRGPKDNPGQLIPEDKLEALLQGLGVTLDRPVVVVHQGDTDTDFGAAARVYWTLKSSGVSQLAILNGGMNAWTGVNLPVDLAATEPTPSDIDITFSTQWLADTEAVADVVEGRREAVLVDARPAAFYEGKKAHGAAARPGTLPGAVNLAHSSFFAEGQTAIDSDNASATSRILDLAPGQEVVSFCNTGHWAATDWFALSELAGIENVKLYPESMVEYSKTDHEMANTPGLLQNLYNQVMAD
jgi:thiosulfate/3-mercaptopyruvate sulfurtransferase